MKTENRFTLHSGGAMYHKARVVESLIAEKSDRGIKLTVACGTQIDLDLNRFDAVSLANFILNRFKED